MMMILWLTTEVLGKSLTRIQSRSENLASISDTSRPDSFNSIVDFHQIKWIVKYNQMWNDMKWKQKKSHLATYCFGGGKGGGCIYGFARNSMILILHNNKDNNNDSSSSLLMSAMSTCEYLLISTEKNVLLCYTQSTHICQEYPYVYII